MVRRNNGAREPETALRVADLELNLMGLSEILCSGIT